MDVDAPGRDRRPAEAARPTRTGDRAAAADPVVGRLLDRRYRVGARIARGGMASVYHATDLRLDRPVAVKVMHAGLGDDEEFAARFVREARAAARLSDPHVVGVHDQGEEDGVVFLVMEYVPGHTLRDVVRADAPLPALRALQLIEPVLTALAAAHRAGLIHRDVKPENVLISDSGQVKVADFGLAKAVGTDTHHTATGGVLIGTVSYLAPEVVVDGRADARADVYAAGVVLYELLTGRKPHEGESPIQVAYKHVHDDVPPPSRTVPGLPAYVDALVARATSRDRDNRPPDAGVLRQQVRRVRQALAEGVVDDPDLVADLRPPAGHWIDPEPRTAPVTAPPTTSGGPTTEVADLDDEPTTALGSRTEPEPWPPPTETGAGPRRPSRRERRATRAARPRRPRRSRRGPVALLLALLLVTGGAGAAWWFGAGRYEPTPSVVGLSLAAARAKAEGAGLGAEVTRSVFSETAPAGQIVSTDPSPGERVLRDGTLGLVVSKGAERYDVPTLTGRTAADAEALLAASHLTGGPVTDRWSETVAEGIVIATDPVAGTALRNGGVVDLVVSKGRRPIKVPDLTGKDADVAQRRLERRTFTVTRTTDYNDVVPEGRVISQTPHVGTLFKDGEVAIVVSLGPPFVTVPSVFGDSVATARSKLESLGLHVDVSGAAVFGGVYSQSPGSGDRVRKGSTVRIYVL